MTQGSTAMDFGRVPISIRGLGQNSLTPTECEMYGSNPPAGCPGGPPAGGGSTPTKPTVFDQINQGLTTLSTIWGNVKGGAGTGPGYPPPPPEKNNTGKIVLISLGGAAVVGGLIWAFSKKKSKK